VNSGVALINNFIATSQLASIALDGRDTVQGNSFGLSVSGTPTVGGMIGLSINSSAQIGGTTAEARNVIVGYVLGISVAGSGPIAIQGNYIGTDPTATQSLGNDFAGIYVTSGQPTFTTNDVLIGGTTPAQVT